ncbi:hypothetical protein GCM10023216_21650 [Isoptericola chiayiensis]|uniref:HNH nuclease domain-containing protein n=1 Tax=Isoptericola chiayiensis TaxID=579446 RepID=A0ABP8YIW5_9MICO|nr:hypothetical protein [Isoptericola chiayiensis]
MFDAMLLTREFAGVPGDHDAVAEDLRVPLDEVAVEHHEDLRATTALGQVDDGLDEVAALQAQIDSLEALKLLAVERVRRTATAHVPELLDEADREVARAGTSRRFQLALRALVADVATTLRITERDAGHLVDTAGTLCRSAPEAVDALHGGRLSLRHATMLADTLADLPDDVRRPVLRESLAGAGCDTPTQFRRRLRRARDRAHPVAADERHRDARKRRDVCVDPAADGMAWLSALLPATGAHAAADRLDRAARAAREAGEDRTAGQLRADALLDLLTAPQRSAAAPSPRPSSSSHDTAHPAPGPSARRRAALDPGADEHAPSADAPSSGAHPDHPIPDLADLARRIVPRVQVTVPVLALAGRDDLPAELDGHGPIDGETAALLTARAPSLRRILVDPVDGSVLTTDATTYAVPAALRALLRARDGTCRFPGCTRSAERSDLDHTRAWQDGGTTGAANLAHLCRHHHVLKHQTRWNVRQAGPDHPPGTLTWTSPTGRRHVTRPASGLDLSRPPGDPPF